MPKSPNALERMLLSPDLQSEIERQKSNSFLQNSKELKDREREDVAHADAVLGDYTRRNELSNNILGLVPTPTPHMPAKQFNPASLAVVPGALKYLRRRAAENQKKFNPPKDIPQLKTILETYPAINGNRNMYRKTAVIAKDTPIASISPSLGRSEIIPVGDSKITLTNLQNIFKKFKDSFQAKNPVDYDERRKLNDDFYSMVSPGARKSTVSIDVNRSPIYDFYNSGHQGSDYNDKNRAGTNLPATLNEALDAARDKSTNIKNRNKTASGLGPREVMAMLPIIKAFYPDEDSVSGHRISGIRAKYDSDPYQEIPLPKMSESEMQKYRSAARKPLHKEISERPKRNLIHELQDRLNARPKEGKPTEEPGGWEPVEDNW